MTMRIVGVDCGLRGGIAVVHIIDGVAPALVGAIDIPVVGSAAKCRVDVIAVREWLLQHQVTHAAIERAQAMPRQGASSGFIYGRATGALEAIIASLQIPTLYVEPSVWKRRHKLRGKDKEGARQLALQLFPSAHALLARKKDHGRAEAALIALSADFIRVPRREMAATGVPKICVECGMYTVDPPSRVCPACEAYSEHRR